MKIYLLILTDTCIQEAEAEEQAQKLIEQFHKENRDLEQYDSNIPTSPSSQSD